MVARYLADHAETLSSATLLRRLASISRAHESHAYENPTRTELVRATLRGIRRVHGEPQTVATPLLEKDLHRVLDSIGEDVRGARDRALLLIGFAGAFRRSEVAGLQIGNIEFFPDGISVTLRRSKTDQLGVGRMVEITCRRDAYCPASSLRRWLALSGITGGPVFRRVDRHGRIHSPQLSGEAVSLVVKNRVESAGMSPDGYSGHSLRAGYVTSAAQAGIPSWEIRRHTGHASEAMLARYVRPSLLTSATLRRGQ